MCQVTSHGPAKAGRVARAGVTLPNWRVASDSDLFPARYTTAQGVPAALRRLESGHVCALYETPHESLLKAFLEIGIERGEKCVCLISAGSRRSTESMMRAASAHILQAVDRGDVEFTTIERAYFTGEVFHAARALNFWRDAGEQAAAEGFMGLRAVVQVDRPLRRRETLMRWMEYENRITEELAARGNTMLCLYSRLAQPAEFVLDALQAHPLVAHRGAIGENTFHVPPEEYNASDRYKRAADRMLATNRSQYLRDTASDRKRQDLQKSLDRRLTEVLNTVTASAGAVQALAADSIRHNREERQLRRSMEYLTVSQRIAQTGSWAWNPSSCQLFWSVEHFRIFGLDPALTRITYDGFFQMVHPEDRAHLAREFEAAVRAGREFDGEFRIVRPDGSVRCIHSRGHALCGESAEAMEYVGTVVDITDQRQQEKKSLESMTAGFVRASPAATAEQLMGAIAHEVNQPLTALVTNAGAALRWLACVRPRLDKTRQALLQIVDDGNRASNVIARIRALLGRAEVERNPLSLNAVVQEVIASTRPELRRHGVTLRTKLDKHLPPVLGDRTQMQQVVLNLIMNAIEAMSSVGTRPRLLLIQSLADLGGVSVCVADSGPGLDEEVLKRMFEAFYTTKVHGMGIGLAISRSIVEGHGGHLWAERKPGQGAIFRFRLPFYAVASG
jgi:PAS domain S-box-containing protein